MSTAARLSSTSSVLYVHSGNGHLYFAIVGARVCCPSWFCYSGNKMAGPRCLPVGVEFAVVIVSGLEVSAHRSAGSFDRLLLSSSWHR